MKKEGGGWGERERTKTRNAKRKLTPFCVFFYAFCGPDIQKRNFHPRPLLPTPSPSPDSLIPILINFLLHDKTKAGEKPSEKTIN